MCIGVVDVNRSNHSFNNVIRFFLETIPVLFHLNDNQRLTDLLQATRNKVYAALGRTGVPTEEILRACNIPSSTTETPLFQVCFNYRMGNGRTSSMNGVDVKFLKYADAHNPFDLVVSVDELKDGTARLTFILQDYLYDQKSAELLANTYTHLLDVFPQDISSSFGSVSVFDTSLAQQAIALGTGPDLESSSPPAEILSKIINNWITKDPDAFSVKDMNENTKTYAQLSERASTISKALTTDGVAPSSPIAVLLEPGVDIIDTILGIFRVGAAYIPLDVRSMDEILAKILTESSAQILLCHAAMAERAKELQRIFQSSNRAKMLVLDTVPQSASHGIENASTPDSLSMILYTSGSTGKPKRIQFTNANIRAIVHGVSKKALLGREIVLQQSGQGFDAAIYQIFIALANGSTLIMGDNRSDPAELAALMAREGVTCTTLIVSEMQSMLNYGYKELRKCSPWRIAMIAGEVFTKNLLGQFRSLNRPDLRIINAYGPTEASICTSMHEVSFNDINTCDVNISIGKAINNHSMYIVDEECEPVPVGWPGEIAINGPGAASGYLNLPELTEKMFKHISSTHASGSDRLYLTGDKGRMLLDGSIVMSGRVDGDDQIKIRGMRVQLEDVSQAIVQVSLGNIVNAAVVLRGNDSNDQQLVAYVVFSRTNQVEDKQTYLRQLSQELAIPVYMRPAVIIALDVFPVTERGKLDTRKLAALPLPEERLNEETNEQLTEQESRLRDVWRSELGDISSHTPINHSSEFFSIGGNSLLLLPLKSKIRQVFAVESPLLEFF